MDQGYQGMSQKGINVIMDITDLEDFKKNDQFQGYQGTPGKRGISRVLREIMDINNNQGISRLSISAKIIYRI